MKRKKKETLIREIENAVCFALHSNVCYLRNFCGLSQEMADELAKHYSAIMEIISEFKKRGRKWN